MVGLATDYCVYYSALDARRLGFDTVVVEIRLPGASIWRVRSPRRMPGMAAAGVQRDQRSRLAGTVVTRSGWSGSACRRRR